MQRRHESQAGAGAMGATSSRCVAAGMFDVMSSPRMAAQRHQFEHMGLLPARRPRMEAAGVNENGPVQRVQINHASLNADVPFPFDTADLNEATSIIRSLAVDHDHAVIIAIYTDLNLHVQAGVGVTPLDRQLLNWLRPIAIAAKQLPALLQQLQGALPNPMLTKVSEVSRLIALGSGGLLASGALLSLDTLVNWMTTSPQTNVIFGSLTMQSPGGNYSVHTPGMSVQLNLVDPETNRTYEGTVEIPDRQSQILSQDQQTNITQNPIGVPTGTQNFHSFALVTTSLLGAVTLLSGGLWWLTKPGQGTLDQIEDLTTQTRRLRKQIILLAQTPP
jgi:hypothetical protein